MRLIPTDTPNYNMCNHTYYNVHAKIRQKLKINLKNEIQRRIFVFAIIRNNLRIIIHERHTI